jgi:hypothetical protein
MVHGHTRGAEVAGGTALERFAERTQRLFDLLAGEEVQQFEREEQRHDQHDHNVEHQFGGDAMDEVHADADMQYAHALLLRGHDRQRDQVLVAQAHSGGELLRPVQPGEYLGPAKIVRGTGRCLEALIDNRAGDVGHRDVGHVGYRGFEFIE